MGAADLTFSDRPPHSAAETLIWDNIMNRYDLLRLCTALSLVLASACGDDDTVADTGTDTGTDTGGGDDTGLDTGGGSDTGLDTGGGDDTGPDTAVEDVGTDTGGDSIVTVTVDNNGNADYNFTMEDPESGVIGAGAGDQTITLVEGQRYTFVVLASGPHPFEFITAGGSPAGDTVILSQQSGDDGTLEADATIDWDESVSGSITFTASASFMAAVDGYRCGVHVGMMRGDVEY